MEKRLGDILSEMYKSAPEGYKVTYIHLFGIKYGEEIKRNNLSVKGILAHSKVKPSFATEVSKGIKLSKYVSTNV
ncbi:hypothetical protein [Planococcus halotolerans]|uniref:HTH-like domain-containing protein n=1 Tax=Planococcus halotolerans TaxID=2233542 RepID=A0A365L6V3_9BACL|nr:hypothetical protein [Planococcus halotolerans]RAZ81115.1 hypothetical protein DP120_02180 [Planococcus halotolerans]